MLGNSAVAILYDGYGHKLDISNDGGIYRLVTKVVGSGIAGSPSTGVSTIQGIDGGTAVNISGTVISNAGTGNFTVVQSTASSLNATVAQGLAANNSGAWTVKITDGTNILGTFSNPIRIDSTGSTIQPVSGTITANIGSTNGLALDSTLSKLTIAQGASLGSNTQVLLGGSVSTSAPSYVNGQISPLSLDTTGALRIAGSISATNPSVSTISSSPPASATFIGGSVTTAAPNYSSGQMNALSLTTGGLLRIDGSGSTQPVSGVGNFSVIGIATDNSTNSNGKLPVLSARANSSAPTWIDGYQVPLSVDTSGALRITGSISAVNNSVGSNNASSPTSSTLIGGSDGTNLQALRAFDLDSGAGTQYVIGVGLRKAASGGSVEFGTSSDPIRVDPTGSTIQPISGTITANAGTGNFTVVQSTAANLNATVTGTIAANQSGTWNITNISGSVALPTGAATEISLAKLTLAQSSTTLGQTGSLIFGAVTTAAPTYTTAQSNPLSLTTSGSLRVDGSGSTQPISGTVTSNQGGSWTVAATQSGTWTVQPGNTANTTPWLTTINQGGNSVAVTASNALKVDGSAVIQPVSGTITSNIGTTNGLALDATLTGGTQQTKLTDGTNTVSVKAASTAVVATDKALVVAISPNNTIAATQSGTWTVQPGNTANTTPWLATINQGGNSATVTASNALKVDGSAVTQPVSGSITANIGTTNGLVLDTTLAKLTIAQGTALGSNTQALIGGSVTTSAPIYTNGQISPLSLDTTGALRITGSISSTNPSVSATNAAPPSSATYIGGSVTTAAPSYTNGQMSPLSLDTTGALRITGSISATNPSVTSNNAAIASSSTQIGGSDGTNLQAIRVFDLDSGVGTQYILGVGLRKAASGGSVELGTASDPIRIDPTGTTTQPISGTITANAGTGNFTVVQATAANLNATVSGTVAATQSGTWNLTNISGTISLPTGAATETSLAKLTLAQGSATSGQSGALILGAVTTAAPLYTTAQSNPLSLTTSGSLRVDGSSSTQPVSGTITANIGTTNGLALDATLTGGTQQSKITDGTNIATVKAASTAAIATDKALVVAISPNNSIATTQSGTWTVQPGNTANTTPWLATINQGGNSASVTASNALKVDGSAVTQPISGTITANIGTSGSLALDANIVKLTIAQGAALSTNTQILIGGSVTTAAPTYTTGNINPLSLTTSGSLRVDGSGSTQPVSGTVSATQSGTWTVQPGNTANTTPWLITLNQGSNSAVVKSSSTPAAATDAALVITQSPNNPYSSIFLSKSFNATTQQTGGAVWTPASGKKIAVSSVVIGSYGTIAARLILWFGSSLDTTYNAGTDQAVLAASFAPSTTANPGLIFSPLIPIFCANADYILRCTTNAGMSVDITVHGYEF